MTLLPSIVCVTQAQTATEALDAVSVVVVEVELVVVLPLFTFEPQPVVITAQNVRVRTVVLQEKNFYVIFSFCPVSVFSEVVSQWSDLNGRPLRSFPRWVLHHDEKTDDSSYSREIPLAVTSDFGR